MARKSPTRSPVNLHWLLTGLVGLLIGCAIDDLPKRSFPKCTQPSAQISTVAQLLDVNFKLESTTGTVGTINNVVWDFGDGKQTETTAMTTQHRFAIPGTYRTSAQLTNVCGDTVTVSKEIIVDNTVSPLVTTQNFVAVNLSSATLSMKLDDNGNGKISRYGVCYSDREGIPTIFNSLTASVSNNLEVGKPVSFTVGQLTASTPYYFRGFAINNAGIGYGSVVSFVTSSPPVVTTIGASLVGITTVSVTFLPVNTGSPPATRYGICYSSSTNTPTVDSPGSSVAPIDAPTIGQNTTLALTNLDPNTTYYYRAFAISAASPNPIYSANTLTFKTQTAIDLTTGLIASYSFDGNGLDASGNNNHGTLMNDAGYGTDHNGKPNAALQLDGINDYFDVPDAPSLRPASISVSLWFKTASLTRTMQIYNKSSFNDGSNEQYSSLIRPPLSGSNRATINVDVKKGGDCRSGVGWQSASLTSSPELNTWHHLVAVFEGNTGRLYFDTALSVDAVRPGGIDDCSGGSLKFGAQYRGIDVNYFHGSIDDVRIYNRALTATQVEALFRQ